MLNIPVHFDDLLKAIDQLSDEQKQMLVEHVKHGVKNTKTDSIGDTNKRIPDMHPGGWISEDFDDPLPDEFWLGEE